MTDDETAEPRDDRLWREMMSAAGLEFQYEIGRDAAAVARDGSRRGFSEEAMETLIRHMSAFIGTRMVRYDNQHGVMPQQMSVRIRVALDHQPRNFDESLERKELPHLLIEKDTDATSQEGS